MRKIYSINRYTIFICLAVLSLISCKEDVEPMYPVLFTGNVVEISYDGVTFTGISEHMYRIKIAPVLNMKMRVLN